MFRKQVPVLRATIGTPLRMMIFAVLTTAFIVDGVATVSACGGRRGGWHPGYCYNPCAFYLPSGFPAQILVRVPADARVYFDDGPTTQGGEVRLYESPPLPAGSEFWYEVRVEIGSGQEVRTETKQVAVVAGQLTQVDFGDLSSGNISTQADPELGSAPMAATPVKPLPPIPPTGP